LIASFPPGRAGRVRSRIPRTGATGVYPGRTTTRGSPVVRCWSPGTDWEGAGTEEATRRRRGAEARLSTT